MRSSPSASPLCHPQFTPTGAGPHPGSSPYRPPPAGLLAGFRSTHPNTKCNFKLQLGAFFSVPTNPVPLLAAGQACLDGALIPSEEFLVIGERRRCLRASRSFGHSLRVRRPMFEFLLTAGGWSHLGSVIPLSVPGSGVIQE